MKPIRDDAGVVALRFLLAAAALATLVALMSCSADVREPHPEPNGAAPSDDFFYRETPAALRTEMTPREPPSPNYQWGGGYWSRYYDRWNGMEPRWGPRPYTYTVWEWR